MRVWLLTSAATLSLCATEIHAQETDMSQGTDPAPGEERVPAAATSGTPTGNQIVITAQRREQSLQDVPVAVTAIDSEQRDLLGIDTIEDITNVTPGLSYNTSLDRASIRGVGRLTNTIGSDPGVAVYNDGFYTSSTVEAAKTPLFVERVEILRGPQGTLYGRNSVGGSINVISRRPTDDFAAEGRVQIEDTSGIIVEGFVSGPLTPGIRGRIAYQFGPEPIFGGIYDNIGTAGDEGYVDRSFIDAQLEFDITPDIELWLKYTSATWDDKLRGGNFVGQYNTLSLADTLFPNPAFGYTVENPGEDDVFTINTDRPLERKLRDNHTIVANLTADMGDVVMKYVGGYQTYYFSLMQDLDGLSRGTVTTSLGASAPYTYSASLESSYVEDKDYFSNEITFSSDTDGDLSWIGGLYWYHENFYQPTFARPIDMGDDFSAALLDPRTFNYDTTAGVPIPVLGPLGDFIPADPNPEQYYFFNSGRIEVDAYAVFGQVDYQVSDQIGLTGGLRYSLDEKTGDEVYRVLNWQPYEAPPAGFCTADPFIPPFRPTGTAPAPGCGPVTQAYDLTAFLTGVNTNGAATRRVKGSWDGFSWRAAITYEPSQDALFYGSYARGLKSGGFRLASFTDQFEVDTEKIDAFELGGKLNPVRGLSINTALFYYIFKDAQVPLGVVDPTTNLASSVFLNLQETNNYGAEIEAVWAVNDWLELRGSYGYINATIEDTGGRLFDDTDIPNVDLNGDGTVSNAEAGIVDIVGNRLPGTSEHKISLQALTEFQTDAGDFRFAASYFYRSDQYSGLFENPLARAPGYDSVDLRASFTDAANRFTIIGYVKNVFDSLGYNSITYGAPPTGFTTDPTVDAFRNQGGPTIGTSYNVTQPRIFGAEVQVRF